MGISALNVTFDDDTFSVDLSDGRSIRIPLVWFPRLLRATPAQRAQYHLSSRGIHWEAIDDDVSVDSLLAGRADATNPRLGRAVGFPFCERQSTSPHTSKTLIDPTG